MRTAAIVSLLVFVARVNCQPLKLIEHMALMSFFAGLNCNNANCPRFAANDACPAVSSLRCVGGSVTHVYVKFVDVQLVSLCVQRLGRPEPGRLDRKRNRPADGPHFPVSSTWSVYHVADATQSTRREPAHRRRPELDRAVDEASNLVSPPMSLMLPCLNDVCRRNLFNNTLDGTLPSELTKLTELQQL